MYSLCVPGIKSPVCCVCCTNPTLVNRQQHVAGSLDYQWFPCTQSHVYPPLPPWHERSPSWLLVLSLLVPLHLCLILALLPSSPLFHPSLQSPSFVCNLPPSLCAIIDRSVLTLQRVPKGTRDAWVGCFKGLLNHCSGPWWPWLMVKKVMLTWCMLAIPVRGGQKCWWETLKIVSTK